MSVPERGAARPPILVIGVGSELRRDDAAGRRTIELLPAALGPDLATDVELRSVHQLTPELAADATGRRLVVVVDAAVDTTAVGTRTVVADPAVGALSHHLDAAALLRLTGVLGAPPDELVTVAVPARDLGLGTELSPATARDVAVAVQVVVERCHATSVPSH